MVFTPSATPEDFSRPSPAPGHTFDGSSVQAPPPAPARYFWKFSVVPDSSLRKNTLMSALGSLASLFSAAIAGSFHFLMSPLKSFAATSGVSTRPSTPSRL